MIRLTLLTFFISFLIIYAWRDWYKALCGLIAMIAVIEHPDMPKTILGVQGLNPWNVVLLSVTMSWLANARLERLRWDMPTMLNRLFIFYLCILVISTLRILIDPSGLHAWAALADQEPESRFSLISEFVINMFKWLVPAIMLYHGCNSRNRFYWAIAAILFVYIFLAVQVVKWMPLSSLGSGDDLKERGLKILLREVGFHRVNLSMMLGGAFWAVMSARILSRKKSLSYFLLFSAVIVFLGQSLTGGRTGYVTWGALGLVLGLIRWRKLLLITPVFALMVLLFVPQVSQRLTEGFSSETRDTNVHLKEELQAKEGQPHWYTITSGRIIAWPYVWEKVLEKPLFGWGREGMKTTGIAQYLWSEFKESFPHPHNLYLQFLLDTGFVGFLPVMFLFYLLIKTSTNMFKDKLNAEVVAIGGMSLSLILALFFAGIGSQTFYPREGSVGMWCVIALMLRVAVLRHRAMRDHKLNQTPLPKNYNLWTYYYEKTIFKS